MVCLLLLTRVRGKFSKVHNFFKKTFFIKVLRHLALVLELNKMHQKAKQKKFFSAQKNDSRAKILVKEIEHKKIFVFVQKS